MKILFSPVGVNDPYTEERDPVTNAVISRQEGPLLQICRQEKPDKVYLYFSGNAPLLEQEDRRFHNALEQLDPRPEVQVILRTDVSDDAPADFLKEDFRSILTDIRDQAPEHAELIVNVFSGTDAMKEAFSSLAHEVQDADSAADDADEAEEIPVGIPEQEDDSDDFAAEIPDAEIPDAVLPEAAEIADFPVPDFTEPEPAAEKADPADDEKAVEDAIAEIEASADTPEEAVFVDPDEEEFPAEEAFSAEPEAPAVDTGALISAEQKRLLTALIDAHEYRAAQTLCMSMEQPPSPAFTALLEAAVLRGSGKWPAAVQMFRDLGHSELTAGITPVTDYFLRLEMLAQRDNCTQFFRAVPAILVDVFLAVIRKEFNADLTQYMIYGSRKWDENKLVMAQLTGKFNETYTYHTKPRPMKVGGFVTTAHLSNYMENFSDRKKHASMILETMKLRQYAEDKVKNVTTYSLSSTTGADMKKFNLLPPSELIVMLRDYIRSYTDINLSDEVLQSYDKMNAALKAALEA